MNREKERLVVIGNGMAGIRCVEEILKHDRDKYDITVLGDEPYPNYNRIALSNVLSGETTQDRIVMNDWDWYDDNKVTLYTNERVLRVDAEEKCLYTRWRSISYDKLILATGSSTSILPITGFGLLGVIGYRTLADCQEMIETAKNYKKAVVIGGGRFGLEAAQGLMNLGMDVQVVYLTQHASVPRAIPLKRTLEEKGLTFLTDKEITEIMGSERVEAIRFADGSEVACDLLVVTAGVRPNITLAQKAGLVVKQGIMVNDFLQTSDPSIYAVGECAEYKGNTYGLIAPLYEHASILAKHLCSSSSAHHDKHSLKVAIGNA